VPAWAWARAGLDVLGVDVRGHGRSAGALAEPSPGGYVLTGIDSPETSVLRGAACDYARAVEVGRALLPGAGRLVLQGASFAGALAVWAEALLGAADLLAVAVPTLGWPEGRRLLARAGSGGEIAAYLDRRPGREEDVMQVLAYFDTVSFAARVRCPALVGIGERDDVVPAPTSLAVARALGGPTEVMRFPVSHTDSPLERCWERFDERLLELAVHGLPDGFGAGRHAPMAAASRTHLS
jgi:cephalosporin-C deacetylase-like acetyl esterase